MEAYLKKLCFEYQVDEREVKELLARMEMVYLDKGETIASATMPEQSLYIIVSGILHTYTCLLYTSDAADEEDSVDLGGRRIIKKKTKQKR